MRKTPISPARRSAAFVTALAAVAASFTWAGAAPALAIPDPGPQTGWQVSSTSTTAHPAPRDITASPDGAKLFVNYEAGNLLSILNTATMGLSTEAPLNGWGEPTIVTPAPDGYRVLTAGTNDVYSLTPGTWTGAAAYGPGVDAMTYSEFTATVFSTDAGQLSERDPLTGELIRWAGLGDMPLAIAAHPSRPVVYTADMSQESISAIDLSGVEWGDICGCEDASTVLDLPGLMPTDIVISADGATLYVLDYYARILAIDTATFTLEQTRDLDGADFASPSLSVNPVTGELVASDLNGTVFFIDPVNLEVTDTVELAEGLWDTAISPDGTKVYVTNTFDSLISVLEYITPAPNPATNVQATPGARQAAVAWTASTTGSATYTVSAVGSDDVLCTTTSTFCVISGLPVGPVRFVVTTATDAGSTPSQPSAAVSISAPAAPASVPAPHGWRQHRLRRRSADRRAARPEDRRRRDRLRTILLRRRLAALQSCAARLGVGRCRRHRHLPGDDPRERRRARRPPPRRLRLHRPGRPGGGGARDRTRFDPGAEADSARAEQRRIEHLGRQCPRAHRLRRAAALGRGAPTRCRSSSRHRSARAPPRGLSPTHDDTRRCPRRPGLRGHRRTAAAARVRRGTPRSAHPVGPAARRRAPARCRRHRCASSPNPRW